MSARSADLAMVSDEDEAARGRAPPWGWRTARGEMTSGGRKGMANDDDDEITNLAANELANAVCV